MRNENRKAGVIAIDGPCGSGKSSVGKIIAAKLGYVYIDTGAMYRAVAYKAIKDRIDPNDNNYLEKLASEAKIEFKNIGGDQHIFLDGEDVTNKIRTPDIARMSSLVSEVPGVRLLMVKAQQEIGRKHAVVMDGRDIGTVVFPDAAVKIYLDASIEERAKRRYREDLERGLNVDYERIKKIIIERDKRDMARKDSPLKQARDAVYIDTTDMSIGEVVNKILEIVRERI